MGDARTIAQEIWQQYEQRLARPPPHHIGELLEREGFLTTSAPFVDVAAGPSPHVGWNLLTHLAGEHDLYFADWRADWLALHKHTYQAIKATDYPSSPTREYWLLGDTQREPHLLTGKAVIIHGDLPRRTHGDRLVLPDTHDEMVATLGGILNARPERLVLYLREEHPEYPESPSRVLPALDHLGAKYRVFENVASADFTPREGGTLLYLTP
jgi:hypothetical protein